ncbi:MAG: hypothetical protein ABW133_25310, partial [Polyangiaceae bacterium]
LRGKPGRAHQLAARFVANQPTTLQASIGTRIVGTMLVGAGGWSEVVLEIPEDFGSDAMEIAIADVTGAGFGSAHYWLYAR